MKRGRTSEGIHVFAARLTVATPRQESHGQMSVRGRLHKRDAG